MSERAELFSAYEWICPSCGKNQFESAITVEFDEETSKSMIEQHGGDPDEWQTGKWVTRPDSVTCKSCNAEFDTTDDCETVEI